MGTLFGIALGSAADSAESAYKTVSGVQQKWAEGDRDERRVKIAENADKRAAKSAADAAAALAATQEATKAEFGAAPATSALAPEAPIGTAPTVSSPPPTSAPTSGIGAAVGAPGYDKLPADGSPVTIAAPDGMDGSDSIVGASGDASGSRARTASSRAAATGTGRTPAGELSATGTSRSGATGDAAAEERLTELARKGNVAAANRLREMKTAKEARGDKERTEARLERESRARIRTSTLEGDKADFELTRARASDSARTAFSTVESELKDVTDATPLSDPTLKGRATRGLDALVTASRDMPDRRTMSYKPAADGVGFDVTYKSYTGAETTERITTAADLKRLGMVAGMVSNPKVYNEYLGSMARTDYMASLERDKAKLEGAELESSIAAGETMKKFNAAFKDKRAMMENPEAIKALAGELSRLDPKKAFVKEEFEITDEDGKKTGKTGSRTRNIWEEMIAREMPAESVTTTPTKKGDKPETIRWESARDSLTPTMRKDIESGKPPERIREEALLALRDKKWPPDRAAFIVENALAEASKKPASGIASGSIGSAPASAPSALSRSRTGGGRVVSPDDTDAASRYFVP